QDYYVTIRYNSSPFFFFQAEDGIRDGHVTGVQTCALPISCCSCGNRASFPQEQQAGIDLPDVERPDPATDHSRRHTHPGRMSEQIGRASCRERVELSVDSV